MFLSYWNDFCVRACARVCVCVRAPRLCMYIFMYVRTYVKYYLRISSSVSVHNNKLSSYRHSLIRLDPDRKQSTYSPLAAIAAPWDGCQNSGTYLP